MTDWRADAPARHSARPAPAHETPKRGNPSQYNCPPEHLIKELKLGELLPAWRGLTSAQEARLAVGPRVPGGSGLWCVGDTSLLQRQCVAIVGTREVSAQGAAKARRLARELAKESVVVVSGLARGVDTCALQAALEAGGSVVAVIGTPVTKASPSENATLQEEIYRKHLLVSPFAPGSKVFKGNFPARNKVMAALSDATVVIEASDTSGTLHQAAECKRLGRWLFIAKSVVEDPSLTWPKSFEGERNTRVLNSVSDIMDALYTPSL